MVTKVGLPVIVRTCTTQLDVSSTRGVTTRVLPTTGSNIETGPRDLRPGGIRTTSTIRRPGNGLPMKAIINSKGVGLTLIQLSSQLLRKRMTAA